MCSDDLKLWLKKYISNLPAILSNMSKHRNMNGISELWVHMSDFSANNCKFSWDLTASHPENLWVRLS